MSNKMVDLESATRPSAKWHKHGGGNILVWISSSAKGTGQLPCIEGPVVGAVYHIIVNKDLLPSVRTPKMGLGLAFCHENDLKISVMVKVLAKKTTI